jgi:uncharacterized protein YggT (Ycf19 family)
MATIQEEITTVQHEAPAHVVKRTTRQVEPAVRGEAPQQVYDTKKTIIRFNQIIWYILGLIEVLLAFRLLLKILGANPTVGFTSFINAITDPFAMPFRGIVAASVTGSSMFEWSTIIAGLVYLCLAWGVIYLLDLVYPITPSDVEAS